MAEVLKLYRHSLKLRPPDHVKIVVDPNFVNEDLPVNSDEFTVLLTLTEWNSPFDIYQQCPLLDHEITYALVGLRKKQALKILSSQTN